MTRFVLRLVGALLVEKICERIRPYGKHTVGFWLGGRWHEHGMGTRYPWQADVMWDASDSALVQAHQKIFNFFERDYMVGVSGTTPEGVDVSTSLYEGWTPTRAGPTTIHFTSTDPDPYWKDE